MRKCGKNSECTVAFQLQERLGKHTTMLRFMDIVFLVNIVTKRTSLPVSCTVE